LIGLGLTALGFGVRFQGAGTSENPSTHAAWGTSSMTYVLVICIVGALIGFGIAFMGLAFHHERRYRERLHHESLTGSSTRMTA
jgi:hypothetical protein